MTALRRMLPPLAAIWLLCQAAGATFAPVTLTMVDSDVECTCGHGAYAMCPMHHRPVGTPRCSIRGGGDLATATLAALLGGIGVIPTRVLIGEPAVAASRIFLADTSRILRSTPPDSPPPRV
jgi:hypothetical protein